MPRSQATEDDDDDEDGGLMSESERHLAKGMSRRTWTGPPMLGSIQPGGGGGLSDPDSLIVSHSSCIVFNGTLFFRVFIFV